MKKENKNLPAVDNDDLRKINSQKVADGVHNLGQYFKDLKKYQKISAIVGVLFSGIIVILIVLGASYGYSVAGLDGIIDTKLASRRFNCTSIDYNVSDTVRYYDEAKVFVDLYGGNCLIYHLKGDE